MRIQYWIMAVLAAALTTAMTSVPASAAATSAGPGGTAGPTSTPGGVSGGSTNEATFLAIVVPEKLADIRAKFTVPTVQCTSSPSVMKATAQVFALPGPDHAASQGGRLAGTGAARTQQLITVAASVVATCTGGSPSYQAQAFGTPLAMTVSPGDTVRLSASFDPTTTPQQQSATVDDITTGTAVTRTRTDKGGFAPISSFAGVQRAKRMPVPDFGAITWSRVRVNGAPIGSAAELFGFNLIRSIAHPQVLIQTSMLSPSGDSYTTTWVAAH